MRAGIINRWREGAGGSRSVKEEEAQTGAEEC